MHLKFLNYFVFSYSGLCHNNPPKNCQLDKFSIITISNSKHIKKV
jgi:hypothetical protein